MKKKLFCVAAIAAVCVASFALGATAATGQMVQAEVSPITKVVIDGSARTFTDGAGAATYPLLYNGSVYLPVRAIGGIMGKNVAWDGNTKTVTLSGTASGNATVKTPAAPAATSNADIATLTGKVDALGTTISSTNYAAANTAQKRAYYNDHNARIEKLDNECDRLSDTYELEYRAGTITRDVYREYERQIDALESRLDGYDDTISRHYGDHDDD